MHILIYAHIRDSTRGGIQMFRTENEGEKVLPKQQCPHSWPLVAKQLQRDEPTLLLPPPFRDGVLKRCGPSFHLCHNQKKWLFIVKLWSILPNDLITPTSYSGITRFPHNSFKRHFYWLWEAEGKRALLATREHNGQEPDKRIWQ